MTDSLHCNISSHCTLCPTSPVSGRNWARVRIGDPHSTTPRVAVCPVHDIAGPVAALSPSLRAAMERDSA